MNRLVAGMILGWLVGCTCPQSPDWHRTFSVGIVGLNLTDIAAGDLELQRPNGALRFACSAALVDREAIPIDCDEEVLGTSFYEPTREWLTSFRVGATFPGGLLTVRLFDSEGELVENWTTDVRLDWGHPLAGVTCMTAQDTVFLDQGGNPRLLP